MLHSFFACSFKTEFLCGRLWRAVRREVYGKPPQVRAADRMDLKESSTQRQVSLRREVKRSELQLLCG